MFSYIILNSNLVKYNLWQFNGRKNRFFQISQITTGVILNIEYFFARKICLNYSIKCRTIFSIQIFIKKTFFSNFNIFQLKFFFQLSTFFRIEPINWIENWNFQHLHSFHISAGISRPNIGVCLNNAKQICLCCMLGQSADTRASMWLFTIAPKFARLVRLVLSRCAFAHP